MKNQQVKYFRNLSSSTDHGLALEIQEYAEKNGLVIDAVSYAVGSRSGHAIVVFSRPDSNQEEVT